MAITARTIGWNKSVARSTAEWIGKTDDERPPDRVRVRVYLRYGGRCQCGCDRLILTGELWNADHKIAIINGGENRESNLVPLIEAHHRVKTRADVAMKSVTYESRKRHLGLKKSKHPMPGSRASGWKRKMDGSWERRKKAP